MNEEYITKYKKLHEHGFVTYVSMGDYYLAPEGKAGAYRQQHYTRKGFASQEEAIDAGLAAIKLLELDS